jgi:hypothetical protein
MTIETFVRVSATDLPFSPLVIFGQNQRMVYHEVLIAGDLLQGDVGTRLCQARLRQRTCVFHKTRFVAIHPWRFWAVGAASLRDDPNDTKLALLRNGHAPNGFGAVIWYV